MVGRSQHSGACNIIILVVVRLATEYYQRGVACNKIMPAVVVLATEYYHYVMSVT